MTKAEFLDAAQKLKRSPAAHNQLCVNYINAYWQKQGHEVRARTESEAGKTDNVPVIRSDTHNGLPK